MPETTPSSAFGERPDTPSRPSKGGQVAAPPGGRALALAKRVAERVLWGRVGVQRRVESRRTWTRAIPTTVPPTGVLADRATWERAATEARDLRLPLHRDKPKNWDALGAVAAVLTLADDGSRTARVMDAGSARYSPVLPWLRLFGLGAEPGSLLGINLEFGEEVRRDGVVFRYGDVTATGLPDAHLDAITCMSVIEHGVPLEGFLAESARVLRSGGVLSVSTDYDQSPPDTTGAHVYGSPVHIFSPAQIRDLIAMAERHGLELVGDLDDAALAHPDRPVHWSRVGLDYTFILLTFVRR